MSEWAHVPHRPCLQFTDLNICSQKLSALPCGKTLVNSWSRWLRESFPFGHSDLKRWDLVVWCCCFVETRLKDRNQKSTVFSSNRVLLRQNSRSLFLRLFPVAGQFLNAGSGSTTGSGFGNGSGSASSSGPLTACRETFSKMIDLVETYPTGGSSISVRMYSYQRHWESLASPPSPPPPAQ